MKHVHEADSPAAQEAPVSKGIPGFAGLAFEQLRSGLQRFLLRRLRNRENAEDLTQEVYLRLLRFTDVELVKRPEAYVYRVAFNVLCEFKQYQDRALVTFDSETAAQIADNLPADAVAPEEELDQRVRERQLDELLQRVPPMQRAVFLLAIRHDVPHAEIAGRLGISLHTVRKYLYRTLLHCRQHLADADGKGVNP